MVTELPEVIVDHEESVPLLVKYFPVLPVCAGSKALTAAVAVICPVPPLVIGTVASVVVIAVVPLPVTSPERVTVWFAVR